MTRLIGFVLAALVFSGGAIHASPMHDDFAKLLERCRVAIEQSLPLDDAELKPVLVHEDHSRSWGTDTTQTGWALENSEKKKLSLLSGLPEMAPNATCVTSIYKTLTRY